MTNARLKKKTEIILFHDYTVVPHEVYYKVIKSWRIDYDDDHEKACIKDQLDANEMGLVDDFGEGEA